MALIKLGGIVTQISGKMGGTSFGTSASCSYAKNSGRPRKSITLKQQAGMALMGTTAQRWRSLTDAQRSVFNAASPEYPYLNRVGDTKYYSGYAIFGMLSNNVNISFGTSLGIPLPKFVFPIPENLTITGNFATLEAVLNGAETDIDYRLFCSRVGSPGVSNSYKNQYFLEAKQLISGSSITFDLAALLQANFGLIPTSGKIFARIDAVDPLSGQAYKNIVSAFHTF